MFQAWQHAVIPVDQQIFRVFSLLMREGNVDRPGVVPALREMLFVGQARVYVAIKDGMKGSILRLH